MNFHSILCMPLTQTIRTVDDTSDMLEEVYVVKLILVNLYTGN